jgi:type I restriction enzyme S subunit
MTSDWDYVRLGDLSNKIGSGATPKGGNAVYLDDGVSLVRSQNVLNGQFRFEGLAHIGNEHADQLAGVTVRAGDVLLNITGDSVARACLVPAEVLPARVNQHVAIVRPDAERLDARFLHYVLTSPSMQQHLLGLAAAGATRKALTKSAIQDLNVPNPPIDEQRRIANVLGAFDDKIEANRKLCATLDTIVRLRFASWFADWEGVDSVQVGDLIGDGALVVGDGYRAKNSEMESTGVPFIRGRDVGNDVDVSSADLLGFDGVRLAGEKVSRAGDAFFTAKGTVGRIGRVSKWTPLFVYSPQIAFWRVLSGGVLLPEFVFMWLRSREFLAQRDAVKGQTDMAEYVNLRDQRAMRMSLPPIDEQVQAFTVITPILDLIALARTESRRLADLRDALLPKLDSGAIRVQEDYEPSVGLGSAA